MSAPVLVQGQKERATQAPGPCFSFHPYRPALIPRESWVISHADLEFVTQYSMEGAHKDSTGVTVLQRSYYRDLDAVDRRERIGRTAPRFAAALPDPELSGCGAEIERGDLRSSMSMPSRKTVKKLSFFGNPSASRFRAPPPFSLRQTAGAPPGQVRVTGVSGIT